MTPEEIATPHLLQIGRGESFGLQAQRQFGEVGGRSTAGHTAVAIEVGAYAHSINTGHVDKVHEVRHAVGHVAGWGSVSRRRKPW